MFSRIISGALALVTCFSLFVPIRASANVIEDYANNDFAQAAFTSGMATLAGGLGGPVYGPLAGFLTGLVADGINNLADYYAAGYTDQDIYDQFTNYNAQLETDLGTTVLFDGGVRVYHTFSGTVSPPERFSVISGVDSSVFFGEWTYGTTVYFRSYTGSDPAVASPVAPFDCSYTYGFDYAVDNAILVKQYYIGSDTFSAGDELFGEFNAASFQSTNYYEPSTAQFQIYVDIYPVASSLPTGLDITPISRPSTLTTPVAVRNDDDTYIVYNQNIVNETDSTIFNPVTNSATAFTDWVFDYSTRTYTLTLEDGSTVSVQYGDSNITIIEGGVTYNAYYVIPSEDDPGTDDPDSPGTDTDVSGFFAWWKEAWTAFTQKFFIIFGGDDIQNILPGEEGNPENEEDDGWTVLDLFALIRDALWKIITGVIHTALDGFLGLVQAIAGLGDFFTVFDRDTEGGVLDILNQGGSAVWE